MSEDIVTQIDGDKHSRFDISASDGTFDGFVRIPKGMNEVRVGPDGIFVNGKKTKLEQYIGSMGK